MPKPKAYRAQPYPLGIEPLCSRLVMQFDMDCFHTGCPSSSMAYLALLTTQKNLRQ